MRYRIPAAVTDLSVVIAGFLLTAVAAQFLVLPASGALAVIAGVLLAWWRLWVRSESWRSVGLRKPQAGHRVALSVVALYFITVAGVVGIVTPISDAMGWPALDVSAYAELPGNLLWFVGILVVVWTTAAFGEEMLFRGFIQGRLQQLFGSGAIGTASAIASQAALFGIVHGYLGARGMLTAALVGAVYGSWYLLRDRNLWPLILAHGLTDTISMAAIYAGVMPEM